MALGDARLRIADTLTLRRTARTLGAGLASLVVLAGTITVFGVGLTVLDSAPAAAALTCNANWTGADSGNPTAWNDALNWSPASIPSGEQRRCVHFRQRDRRRPQRLLLHRRAHRLVRQHAHRGHQRRGHHCQPVRLRRPRERRDPDGRPVGSGFAGLTLNGSDHQHRCPTADGTVTIGDAHFLAATGILAEEVAPMSTTTSVVVSPSAPTYGQSVTLTSTVAPTSGTTDPVGTVTFSVDGTTLGSSLLSTTDGVTTASMLVTTLPVGSDFVTASYDGGAGFLASSSATAARVVVSRTPTSLGLLTSDNPSPLAQSVTFTATIFPTTGSGETGTVTFFDNGVDIGTSSVSNGQATISTTGLPSGTDPITASYGGDGDFVASMTVDTLGQLVNDPPPARGWPSTS